MLKKIGLPMLAVAAGLLFVPHQAKAAVRFGVYVGAPAYSYVYPAYAYAYGPRYVAPHRPWFRYHRWEHRRDWR